MPLLLSRGLDDFLAYVASRVRDRKSCNHAYCRLIRRSCPLLYSSYITPSLPRFVVVLFSLACTQHVDIDNTAHCFDSRVQTIRRMQRSAIQQQSFWMFLTNLFTVSMLQYHGTLPILSLILAYLLAQDLLCEYECSVSSPRHIVI